MSKPATVLIPLLILVFAFGTAGCGGDQGTDTPTPVQTPATTPTPAETPVIHPTPPDDEEARVVIGDTVQVHYTGWLGNGTIFDSSLERGPGQFTLGQGQVIVGFEQAVLGMAVGESKTVVIPAAEAYGPHYAELVTVKDRRNLPPDWEPEINDKFPINQPDGSVIWARVTEITESTVTLDANHPLAGQDLSFEIELVDIL